MDQIFYVSSAGSNTSPYDTWAKAATKLKTATDMAGTRDKIYVDSAHTESTTGAVTLAVAGDVQICRASTSAEPPTELGTYGVDITYTGSLTFSGSFYCQGISFNAGAGSSTFNFIFGSTNADRQIFKDCCFYFGTTGVSSTFLFGASTASNASYLLFLAPLFYSIGSSAVQALSLRNAFVEMWAGDYFDENYGPGEGR